MMQKENLKLLFASHFIPKSTSRIKREGGSYNINVTHLTNRPLPTYY